MLTTNNANEGALDAMQVYFHVKPTSSLHLCNALTMFHRNNTHNFMTAKLKETKHTKYLMKEVQILDESKAESQCHAALVDAEKKLV